MVEKDVKDASAGVLKDLKRFQLEKEDDLKRYMVRPLFSPFFWEGWAPVSFDPLLSFLREKITFFRG